MGLLRSPEGAILPPSCLVATKYLPSLDKAVWEKSDLVEGVAVEDQVELDKAQQLAIRRARLSVEILKRPSDNNAKYDLFQRLNAGGTQANAQELRNCIVIMVNRDYFATLKALSEGADYSTVLGATEEQVERQRHVEYATRFLVQTFIPYDGKLDVEEYIDNGIVELAMSGSADFERSCFTETFALLRQADGANALRRFDGRRHVGRVGLVALECIAVGIGQNIEAILELPDPVGFVRDKARAFWQQPDTTLFLSQGMRGTTRIQRTVPFGSSWFSP
jgi:hypothetical protein